MKHFFQTMFASIFGVLIAMGLLILGGISFLVGVAASSNSSAEYKPKENTVFKLKLEGTVSDQVTENPFNGLFGDGSESMSLVDITKAIRKAQENSATEKDWLDFIDQLQK